MAKSATFLGEVKTALTTPADHARQVDMRSTIISGGVLLVRSVTILIIITLQLHTFELYGSATASKKAVENAGEGSGMDESSIGEIGTEMDFFDWVEGALIPAVRKVRYGPIHT